MRTLILAAVVVSGLASAPLSPQAFRVDSA